jgi:hypothetical protein
MIGRRGLLALGAAAAVTLAAVVYLTPEDAPGPPTAALAFPGLAQRLGQAARIELRRHDAGLTLIRDGDAWTIAERFGHPAQPQRVRSLLTGLSELRLLEPRPTDARGGTDDPLRAPATGLLIRVLNGAGAALAEVILGTRRSRPGEETALVRRPGEAGAWLADTRLSAEADPELWLAREVADLPAQRLRRVEVARAGEAPLVLARPGEVDAPLVILGPPEPPRPDGVALDALGRVFEGLSLLAVRPATDIAGEALGETRFAFTDNLLVRAFPRREGDQLWVTLRAEGDAEAEALNRRWGPWAYQLGIWTEAALIPRLEDLLEGR